MGRVERLAIPSRTIQQLPTSPKETNFREVGQRIIFAQLGHCTFGITDVTFVSVSCSDQFGPILSTVEVNVSGSQCPTPMGQLPRKAGGLSPEGPDTPQVASFLGAPVAPEFSSGPFNLAGDNMMLLA